MKIWVVMPKVEELHAIGVERVFNSNRQIQGIYQITVIIHLKG